MRNPYPGFLKTFGSHMGVGLAESLLDRWFPAAPNPIVTAAIAMLQALPQVIRALRRMADDPEHVAQHAPAPFVPLGEFTCPKCGGHTWGTLDMATGEKYCTNGYETRYPEYNPNTVAEPCMFRWNKASDYLYFAAPTPEDFRRTETQTCSVPATVNAKRCADAEGLPTETERLVALSDLGPAAIATGQLTRLAEFLRDKFPGEFGRGDVSMVDIAIRLLGDGPGESPIATDEQTYTGEAWYDLAKLGSGSIVIRTEFRPGDAKDLAEAIGDRKRSGLIMLDAAAIIRAADAYILKQSKEIERLIFENEFKTGCGEISVEMSRDMAKQIGIAYEEGGPPLRVTLLLSDWRWSVRVGTALIQIDWDTAAKFARAAMVIASLPPDATEMAQNAAGGVA